MAECTYCGCDVFDHDPVFVSEDVDALTADARTADARTADAYCNYACLAAHIDEAGLTTGATCRVDL